MVVRLVETVLQIAGLACRRGKLTTGYLLQSVVAWAKIEVGVKILLVIRTVKYSKVLPAQTNVDRQPLCQLPRILTEDADFIVVEVARKGWRGERRVENLAG